ncbi:MAG: hypothetical protein K8R34_03170 [Methanosarcinales archaeon]|nr:hypothetical protein [Methanosarcinales archaeon]
MALFIKCLPKYSVSYLSKMIKKGSKRIFKKRFALLNKLCGYYLSESGCHHGSVGIVSDVIDKYTLKYNSHEYKR